MFVAAICGRIRGDPRRRRVFAATAASNFAAMSNALPAPRPGAGSGRAGWRGRSASHPSGRSYGRSRAPARRAPARSSSTPTRACRRRSAWPARRPSRPARRTARATAAEQRAAEAEKRAAEAEQSADRGAARASSGCGPRFAAELKEKAKATLRRFSERGAHSSPRRARRSRQAEAQAAARRRPRAERRPEQAAEELKAQAGAARAGGG